MTVAAMIIISGCAQTDTTASTDTDTPLSPTDEQTEPPTQTQPASSQSGGQILAETVNLENSSINATNYSRLNENTVLTEVLNESVNLGESSRELSSSQLDAISRTLEDVPSDAGQYYIKYQNQTVKVTLMQYD